MRTQDCTDSIHTPAAAQSAAALEQSTSLLWNAPARAAAFIWKLLVEWQGRSHQRQAMRLMDERTLRDIGITRDQMEREAGKPFWLP